MTQPYGIRKVVGSINAEGDAYWPAAMRRTYFEQQALRKFIRRYLGNENVKCAVEFGCGYGRMLPVLSEFADHVIGLERDKELAAIASSLQPPYDIRLVKSLGDASHGIKSATADLILTYTVLQHLTDEECRAAIIQMQQIFEPCGVIIICEDTPGTPSPDYYPRSSEQYYELFHPMTFFGFEPRRRENGNVVGEFIAIHW